MLNALRYLVPLVGVLGFLGLSMASLYPKPRLREWQHKAEMLLGLFGMAFFGLFLYGVARRNLHYWRFTRGFLGGVVVGIFVTLLLEGSFRPFKRREPEPPPQ